MELRCAAGADKPIPRVKTASVSKNSCQPVLFMDTEEGCVDASFNVLWSFFQKNATIFGASIIAAGLFLGLFGGQFKGVTLFLAGSSAVMALFYFITYAYFLPQETPDFVHWIVLAFGAVGGALFGMVCASFVKLGCFLIGAWVGASSGTMGYDLFFVEIIGLVDKYAFWACVVLGVILGGLLTFYLFEHTLIVGSAIFGGYALMRGLSVFIGGFPNEILLYSEIEAARKISMPTLFYVYLALYIVFAIGFFVFQERGKLLARFFKDQENQKKG